MTVLLVLATFVLFLVVDHFYSKRPAVRPVMEVQPQAGVGLTLQPNVVSGFVVPDNVRYHPGHTWALAESPKLVRIGFDDFASRLMGRVEKITLPQRGQWVRQGQKIWSVERSGMKTDMVSPIEGVVTEINEAAAQDPNSARRDPYGEGWMLTVESPDAKLNFRNLLNGDLARWWMEEAATRLRSHLPIPAGAVAQDGGMVVSDLGTGLTDDAWKQATQEFFLG